MAKEYMQTIFQPFTREINSTTNKIQGIGLGMAIRASAHSMAKKIPIIAMTANACAEGVKNALDAGMDAHVAKPIDFSMPETAVQNVFGR